MVVPDEGGGVARANDYPNTKNEHTLFPHYTPTCRWLRSSTTNSAEVLAFKCSELGGFH